MKKKVICFPFVGNNLGGSHYSTLELINKLDKRKFETILVVHQKGYFYKFLKKKKYKINLLPINKFVGEDKGFFLNLYRIFRLFFPIRNFINKNNVDIVHANDASINLSWVIPSKLSFIKFIWHQRIKFASEWNLYRLLSFFSDRIICVSNYVLKGMPSFLKRKSVKIYNPISLGKIKKDSNLKKKYFSNKNKNILFLGNIIKRKKIDIFLKAIDLITKNYSSVKCFIVGLDKKSILKNLIKKKRNSNLINVGFSDNPFFWLRNCDLILSPAVDEALGRNIVESMLSKIPVIASNSGGNSEIIKNGSTGWLFEKDNYIDLAKKSIYVLRMNKSKLNKILLDAHTFVSNKYSVKRHVENIEKIYFKL